MKKIPMIVLAAAFAAAALPAAQAADTPTYQIEVGTPDGAWLAPVPVYDLRVCRVADAPVPIYQVGTPDGAWLAPVPVEHLLVFVGEAGPFSVAEARQDAAPIFMIGDGSYAGAPCFRIAPPEGSPPRRGANTMPIPEEDGNHPVLPITLVPLSKG